MLDQTLELGIETVWVLWLGVDDLLIDVHGVIIKEWGVTGVHLVNQDSEGPPIDWLRVSLVEENLGRNVFWGSANGVSSLLDDLGKTVINQLQVAIVANHNVLWLQVSVDDIFTVEVLED